MTLVLRTAKGAVSFEWTDEDAETVVRIEPTDTDEVMLRKLKRVVALVEGEQEPMVTPQSEAALRAYTEAYTGLVGEPPRLSQPTNGWAAMAEPKVPEHLADEVELIKPEEGA